MFNRISHIGIVVADREKALAIWRDQFGLRQFAEMRIEAEGIHSVFLSVSGRNGEMAIELMEPLDKSDMRNPVARRLAQKGEGFYHVAMVSGDVGGAGRTLKEGGLTLLERPAAAEGDAGRWLVHPRSANGVMVEGLAEWAAGD
ncbi:MAG: VOC family protein [Myxococcota bacterium]